ncbi:MAG: cytochrome c [Terriglobales bacterium]|jgi:mono/diheme cytochrome c family protein
MRIRSFACLVTLALASATVATAQEASTEVKHGTAPATSPGSGKEMFSSYCASCHGKDAKGDGPAAASLKVAPSDLTTLAKRNGGKYPADKVTSILRGQANLVPHGDQEMPVWGPVFWKMSGGREEVVQQRIANLNRYLESLQAK